MWKSPAVGLFALFLGCAPADTQIIAGEPTPETTTATPMSARLIIRFKDSVSEPSNAAFLDGLSHDAGTLLTYLRPVSVGSHVFECREVYSSDELAEVIQRLTRRKDVIYVEQDRILQHQKIN